MFFVFYVVVVVVVVVVVIIIIELTHSKTILQNTIESSHNY